MTESTTTAEPTAPAEAGIGRADASSERASRRRARTVSPVDTGSAHDPAAVLASADDQPSASHAAPTSFPTRSRRSSWRGSSAGTTRCAIRPTGGCRGCRSRVLWSSSASPATCRARSCCRRSTTWPTAGCCRPTSSCSGSPGATGRTATSRTWPRNRPRTTPGRTGTRRSGPGCRATSSSCPDRSTTTTPSTSWPARSTSCGRATASRATPRSTCPSRRRCSRPC